MIKIGKTYHYTHVVRDLDAADRWYNNIFSVLRSYRAYMPEALRHASLVIIADFVLEPMQLANVPGAATSPIGKFLERFGEQFHSMAFYVDSVPETFDVLSSQGIRIFDDSGAVATRQSDRLWTHPKDTHALVEFASPSEFSTDPRLHPAWSPDFWRDRHPLRIERASHVTVRVRDLDAARRFYGDLIGGKLLHEEARGATRNTFYAVGTEAVVELAQPLSASSKLGQELTSLGEGISALTLKTKDLEGAAEFLASKDQRSQRLDEHTLVLDKAQAFGLTLRLTDWSIPNDSRTA